MISLFKITLPLLFHDFNKCNLPSLYTQKGKMEERNTTGIQLKWRTTKDALFLPVSRIACFLLFFCISSIQQTKSLFTRHFFVNYIRTQKFPLLQLCFHVGSRLSNLLEAGLYNIYHLCDHLMAVKRMRI